MACCNGHIKVVRQLYKWKPTIDISSRDEMAFIMACFNRHLKVVRQLYKWKPTIDISKFNQYRSLFLSLGILSPLTKESIPEGETLQCPICMNIIQNEISQKY